MIARSKDSRKDVHAAVEILPISNEKDIKGSEIWSFRIVAEGLEQKVDLSM